MFISKHNEALEGNQRIIYKCRRRLVNHLFKMLNACDYNVRPQDRKECFLLGLEFKF
jgi:hypothetical protein